MNNSYIGVKHACSSNYVQYEIKNARRSSDPVSELKLEKIKTFYDISQCICAMHMASNIHMIKICMYIYICTRAISSLQTLRYTWDVMLAICGYWAYIYRLGPKFVEVIQYLDTRPLRRGKIFKFKMKGIKICFSINTIISLIHISYDRN